MGARGPGGQGARVPVKKNNRIRPGLLCCSKNNKKTAVPVKKKQNNYRKNNKIRPGLLCCSKNNKKTAVPVKKKQNRIITGPGSQQQYR